MSRGYRRGVVGYMLGFRESSPTLVLLATLVSCTVAQQQLNADTADCDPSDLIVNSGLDKKQLGLTEPVILEGGGTFDLKGMPVTFQWRFDQPPETSRISNENIHNAHSPMAYFTPDVPGTYRVELMASNGCVTATDIVVIDVICNTPPLVQAGDDFRVTFRGSWNTTIDLNGGATIDIEGDPMQYRWRFLAVPKASLSVNDDIRGIFSKKATVSIDKPGEYTFELMVSDGCKQSSDTVTVFVECLSFPIAQAGSDLSFKEGDMKTVALDGKASVDPNGELPSFYWTFASLPERSNLDDNDIRFNTQAVATFNPDVNGEYVVNLRVTNICGTTEDNIVVSVESSEVVIENDVIVCNERPVADAGVDHQVTFHGAFTKPHLMGTTSYDPDGDQVTFEWRVLKKPVNSGLQSFQIEGRLTNKASFYADVVGVYEVELIVSDGCSESQDATIITVICNNPPSPIIDDKMIEIEWDKESGVPLGAVAIDGSRSYDPDKDNLKFWWEIESIPAISSLTDATLHQRNESVAYFVPDCEGEYVIGFFVKDDCSSRSDIARVIVTLRDDWNKKVCNRVPRVDAGGTYSVAFEGDDTQVVLDASLTHDLDADELSYSWEVIGQPEGSQLSIDDSNVPVTSMTVNKPGLYDVKVEVSDGCNRQTGVTHITVRCDFAPFAFVTSNNTHIVWDKANDGDISNITFYADGSTSFDPDIVEKRTSLPIAYSWELTSMPFESAKRSRDIVGRDQPRMQLSPDKVGEYEVQLTVADACSSSSATARFTVSSLDLIPTDECNDQPVAEVSYGGILFFEPHAPTVEFDARGSYDVNGDTLTYIWRFVSTPGDSQVTDECFEMVRGINDWSKVKFVADRPGEYDVQVLVTDGCTNATAKNFAVVECVVPFASISGQKDYEWSQGEAPLEIFLDGSQSFTLTNSGLEFKWWFESVPEGSTVNNFSIEGSELSEAVFYADTDGEYVVSLRVRSVCGEETATETFKVGVAAPECNASPVAVISDDQELFLDYETGMVETTVSSFGTTDENLEDIVEVTWSSAPKVGDVDTEFGGSEHEMEAIVTLEGEGVTMIVLEVTDGCTTDVKSLQIVTNCPPAVTDVEESRVVEWDKASQEMISIILEGETTMATTYKWSFNELPEKSKLRSKDILHRSAKVSSFSPDVEGDYSLSFWAGNNCGGEDRSYVTVSVVDISAEMATGDSSDESGNSKTKKKHNKKNHKKKSSSGHRRHREGVITE